MSYVTDFYWQWTIAVGLLILIFCSTWVRARFGLAASLLMACSIYSALWVWLFRDNRYLPIEPYNQMALRYFACDSVAKIMLVAVPLMILSEKRMTFLLMGEVLTSTFVFLSSIYALWQARLGCTSLSCGGLVGNPSISMGLMACMLPIAIRHWRWQWPVLLLASSAILVSQSSIALGLLATYFALYLFPWKILERRNYGRLALSCASFFGVLGLGRIALGGELTNDSDRFKIWQFMFDRWRAPWNILQGTGIGTYHVFSINLQHIPGRPAMADGYWWNTLHNDYLQMLFECGVVGLVLLLAAYFSALFKIIREKDYPIAVSLVLYGLYMGLDPALHNPIPILFGAWAFVYALRREPNNEEYV